MLRFYLIALLIVVGVVLGLPIGVRHGRISRFSLNRLAHRSTARTKGINFTLLEGQSPSSESSRILSDEIVRSLKLLLDYKDLKDFASAKAAMVSIFSASGEKPINNNELRNLVMKRKGTMDSVLRTLKRCRTSPAFMLRSWVALKMLFPPTKKDVFQLLTTCYYRSKSWGQQQVDKTFLLSLLKEALGSSERGLAAGDGDMNADIMNLVLQVCTDIGDPCFMPRTPMKRSLTAGRQLGVVEKYGRSQRPPAASASAEDDVFDSFSGEVSAEELMESAAKKGKGAVEVMDDKSIVMLIQGFGAAGNIVAARRALDIFRNQILESPPPTSSSTSSSNPASTGVGEPGTATAVAAVDMLSRARALVVENAYLSVLTKQPQDAPFPSDNSAPCADTSAATPSTPPGGSPLWTVKDELQRVFSDMEERGHVDMFSYNIMLSHLSSTGRDDSRDDGSIMKLWNSRRFVGLRESAKRQVQTTVHTGVQRLPKAINGKVSKNNTYMDVEAGLSIAYAQVIKCVLSSLSPSGPPSLSRDTRGGNVRVALDSGSSRLSVDAREQRRQQLSQAIKLAMEWPSVAVLSALAYYLGIAGVHPVDVLQVLHQLADRKPFNEDNGNNESPTVIRVLPQLLSGYYDIQRYDLVVAAYLISYGHTDINLRKQQCAEEESDSRLLSRISLDQAEQAIDYAEVDLTALEPNEHDIYGDMKALNLFVTASRYLAKDALKAMSKGTDANAHADDIGGSRLADAEWLRDKGGDDEKETKNKNEAAVAGAKDSWQFIVKIVDSRLAAQQASFTAVPVASSSTLRKPTLLLNSYTVAAILDSANVMMDFQTASRVWRGQYEFDYEEALRARLFKQGDDEKAAAGGGGEHSQKLSPLGEGGYTYSTNGQAKDKTGKSANHKKFYSVEDVHPTPYTLSAYLRCFHTPAQLYVLQSITKAMLFSIAQRDPTVTSGNRGVDNHRANTTLSSSPPLPIFRFYQKPSKYDPVLPAVLDSRSIDELMNAHLRCGNLPEAIAVALQVERLAKRQIGSSSPPSVGKVLTFSDSALINLLIHFDRYWRDYDSATIYDDALVQYAKTFDDGYVASRKSIVSEVGARETEMKKTNMRRGNVVDKDNGGDEFSTPVIADNIRDDDNLQATVPVSYGKYLTVLKKYPYARCISMEALALCEVLHGRGLSPGGERDPSLQSTSSSNRKVQEDSRNIPEGTKKAGDKRKGRNSSSAGGSGKSSVPLSRCWAVLTGVLLSRGAFDVARTVLSVMEQRSFVFDGIAPPKSSKGASTNGNSRNIRHEKRTLSSSLSSSVSVYSASDVAHTLELAVMYALNGGVPLLTKNANLALEAMGILLVGSRPNASSSRPNTAVSASSASSPSPRDASGGGAGPNSNRDVAKGIVSMYGITSTLGRLPGKYSLPAAAKRTVCSLADVIDFLDTCHGEKGTTVVSATLSVRPNNSAASRKSRVVARGAVGSSSGEGESFSVPSIDSNSVAGEPLPPSSSSSSYPLTPARIPIGVALLQGLFADAVDSKKYSYAARVVRLLEGARLVLDRVDASSLSLPLSSGTTGSGTVAISGTPMEGSSSIRSVESVDEMPSSSNAVDSVRNSLARKWAALLVGSSLNRLRLDVTGSLRRAAAASSIKPSSPSNSIASGNYDDA